ncbi:MAG: PIN domain-containing protein [Streptosporangiales bacterium]|nr:PIN domain-containing protein [Streptosporangiales bacterium]
MIYLDAAAVIKLAHYEAGSRELELWLTERPLLRLVSSSLIEVEVPRALRRWNPPALPRVPPLLESISRMDIKPVIRAAAAAFEEPTLRSLDALHLATAQQFGAELEAFVTYDRRLLAAAKAAGLPVACPGTEPAR